ncbi:uncharacterized protein ATC70_003999 [Mucor velutinosus]|uniref:Uncharacterized protein n=1 Tax=Mucor velutinosus TaxID=708070 RepID=A0AAN7HRI8_9FUNG|nr:hypothetical protein ATC70_003999 [Mucor velutinosus]
MTSYSVPSSVLAQQQSITCTVVRAVIDVNTAHPVTNQDQTNPTFHVLAHLNTLINTVALRIPYDTLQQAMRDFCTACGMDFNRLSLQEKKDLNKQHLQITATGELIPTLEYNPFKVLAPSNKIQVNQFQIHTDSLPFERLGDIPRARTGRFHNFFAEDEELEQTYEFDIPDAVSDDFEEFETSERKQSTESDAINISRDPLSTEAGTHDDHIIIDDDSDNHITLNDDTNNINVSTAPEDMDPNVQGSTEDYTFLNDADSISSSATPTQATVNRHEVFEAEGFLDQLLHTFSFASVNDPPTAPSSFANSPSGPAVASQQSIIEPHDIQANDVLDTETVSPQPHSDVPATQTAFQQADDNFSIPDRPSN